MLSRNLGALLTIVTLLLTSATDAAPTTHTVNSRTLKQRDDAVDDPDEDLPWCKGLSGRKIGGPGTGYFSLRRSTTIEWTNDVEVGIRAEWFAKHNILQLITGTDAYQNQIFVFKINNWATKEPGVNYAYEVPKTWHCQVKIPTTYIKPTSTYSIKVLPNP